MQTNYNSKEKTLFDLTTSDTLENEKRSNLTPTQVQQAAERLLASDPSFTRKPGRLKKGQRALTPFLANTFGVSTRYVRALLNEGSSETNKTKPSTSSES